MEIDRGLVQDVRDEVFQALNAIAARHGLNVEQQKNVTFYSDHFSIKYIFSDATVDLARKEFENKCWQYGLSENDYGRTFVYDGKTIVIRGINTRARKYPIQYSIDGKPMKCGPDFMKIMMNKAV